MTGKGVVIAGRCGGGLHNLQKVSCDIKYKIMLHSIVSRNSSTPLMDKLIT